MAYSRNISYSRDTIEDIRHGNDIVEIVSSYVRLDNKSGRLFGLCPFHKEKTPSFSVSQERQTYHCFGCGESGDVVRFVMKAENYAFLDALRFLAERIGYAIPEYNKPSEADDQRELLKGIHKAAARYFFDTLATKEGEAASHYLDERGLSPAIRRRFGLGFAPRQPSGLLAHLKTSGYNEEAILSSGLVLPSRSGGLYSRFSERLIFPIFDVSGDVIGFGGRSLTDTKQPKYLNSQESPIFNKSRVLYGLANARKTGAREYILAEGYMDVLSLHQAGFTNCVAALGTSLSQDHARILKRYAVSVLLAFDADDAGTKASLKAIPLLGAEGLLVRVLSLQGAKDPDEFVRRFGEKALEEAIRTASSQVLYRSGLLRAKYDISSVEGRIAFLREVSEILAEIPSITEREVYIDRIAHDTDTPKATLMQEAARLAAKPTPVNYPSSSRARQAQNRARQIAASGIENARKNILRLAATNARVRSAILPFLEPAELVDETYKELMHHIYAASAEGQTPELSELAGRFTDPEKSAKAAQALFAPLAPLLDTTQSRSLEKCVNDIVRSIKKHNIDKGLTHLATAPEYETLGLMEAKRNLDRLYIHISDG